MKWKQKRESWKLDCQKCGAELSMIIEQEPSWMDFKPHCPYCQTEIVLEVSLK